MSEPESFVSRWSRLKRQAGRPAEGKPPNEPAEPASGAAVAGEPAKAGQAENPPAAFDPSTLPPIESITAETDIRAFLQSGVPAELSRAALRRVWTTDPAIRDFIGIAENQWDFTAPGAIPGFGPLEPTDDVCKLVAQAMGSLGEAAEQLAEHSSDTSEPGGQRTAAAPPPRPVTTGQAVGIPEQMPETEAQHSRVNVAPQDGPNPVETLSFSNRRGHGSAMPQ
jgi:Protein of unknown function (DUF3306)